MKNLVKVMLLSLWVVTITCCSKDNQFEIQDNRSFLTNDDVDFFINHDGSVNLILSGKFYDNSEIGAVVSRGFVYGTNSNPQVNPSNTSAVSGSDKDAVGYLKNLKSDQIYFVRGYFEMSDGAYFYGNEIQASTDVDASKSRTITLSIKPETYWQSSTAMTIQVDISDIKKEMPKEIIIEYSLNSDFSNSTTKVITEYKGIPVISWYQNVISGLQPATSYYFKAFAKYADGTITNGGGSTESFTTSNKQ